MRIQVPFESLKRAAKEKKNSLDEVSSVVKMLDVQTAAAMTTAEQLDVLSKMALRLQNLKRKVAVSFSTTAAPLLQQVITNVTCCSLKKAVRKNVLML